MCEFGESGRREDAVMGRELEANETTSLHGKKEQEPSKRSTGRAFIRYERLVEVIDGEALSKLGA
jgi:hypothetical protein